MGEKLLKAGSSLVMLAADKGRKCSRRLEECGQEIGTLAAVVA